MGSSPDALDAALDGVTHDQGARDLLGALQSRLFPGPPATPRLGRYELGRVLGRGGMGVVHRAVDPQLDRVVAIKMLRAGDEDGGRRKARLLREAEALAAISHPNVVSVFDVGIANPSGHQGVVYLVMEYIDGQSLSRWLRRQRSFEQVLDVFVAAGEGLVAAHACGLVHRDFKPDNVMLGHDPPRVRVLDFGLAHAGESLERDPHGVLRPTVGQSVTETGTVMGTPAYMAPEQWRGRSVESTADQYAFCVALREAIFGDRVTVGGPPVRTRPALLVDAPTQRRLLHVLRRGLMTDPSERYPTMRDLLDALHEAARPRAHWSRTVALLGVLGVAFLGSVMSARPDVHPGDASRSTSPNPAQRQSIALHVAEATELFALGDLAGASKTLEAAHLRAVEGNHTDLALDTAIELARVHRSMGTDLGRVKRWLRRAEAFGARIDPSPQQLAKLLWVRAEVEHERGRPRAARRHLDAAVDVLRSAFGSGDRRTVEYRSKLVHHFIQIGDTQAAMEHAEALQRDLQANTDDPDTLRILLDMAYARVAVQDQTGALALGETVAGAAERLGIEDRDLKGKLHLLQATVSLNLDRFDDALEHYAALRELEPSDIVAMQIEAGTGTALCRRGDPEAGLAHLKAKLDALTVRHGPDSSGMAEIHGSLSDCYRTIDDEVSATQHSNEARRILDRVVDPTVDLCSPTYIRRFGPEGCEGRTP